MLLSVFLIQATVIRSLHRQKQILIFKIQAFVFLKMSATVTWLIVWRTVRHCSLFSTLTADELPNYSVTTLAIVIVAPIIVLIILSAIAILVFRRIHHNQMERLTSRDAEYGTIDGLIASNVGESTLAVSSGYYRGYLEHSVCRGEDLLRLLERLVQKLFKAYFNWLVCWIWMPNQIKVFYLNPCLP